MLRVVGTTSSIKGSVAFDEYVPFRFRSTDEVLPGPMIWRCGDFESMLFELKVCPDTYVVKGASLVNYHGNKLGCPLFGQFESSIPDCLPIIDGSVFPKNEFPRNSVDYRSRLAVAKFDRQLQISFTDLIRPWRLLSCDRVSFVIDSGGFICGVTINELSQLELNLLSLSLAE